MFELALAHINQSDRERDTEAALQRRRLIEAAQEATVSHRRPTPQAATANRAMARLRAVGQ